MNDVENAIRELLDKCKAQEAENKRLRSELLAAERKDWTPSKGGRLG